MNGPVHFGSVDPEQFTYKTSRAIGADTAEVLAELGYSKEEIDAMFANGHALCKQN